MEQPPVDLSDGGKLAYNIMHFARALRIAGLPAGPGKVIEAVRAVAHVGPTMRVDFYWALFSVFVARREHRNVFDQAFHVFWRDPGQMDTNAALIFADSSGKMKEEEAPPLSRRVADALVPDLAQEQAPEEIEIEIDASLTYSAREVLQEMDFETMSAEELEEAKRMIARLVMPLKPVPTRRFRSHPAGAKIDMRASLRASLRSSGDMMPLKRKRPGRRPPPLVILCDVSGSMSRYSRMFLHFVHAITNNRDRVHSFLFGTRLTNITRHLHHRDVDIAVERATRSVEDWSGGTRIGPSLKVFNKLWSRRVLGQGAIVLIITDGLDRAEPDELRGEIERLHRSCRRLIWLNPLLRFEGFRPEAGGIKAMLPHVDDFRTAHNINSLIDIADALNDVRRNISPLAARSEAEERVLCG